MITSWTRSRAWVFASSLLTCVLTVATLTTYAAVLLRLGAVLSEYRDA